MSGTIFFTCLTSSISALPVALRISAWQAAPKRRRKGCKNREKMTGLWQSQSQRLDKSFICDSPIASKSPGILKESSRQIGCSGNLEEEEIPIPTQRRVLKDGKWMLYWKDVQGNLSRQKKSRKVSHQDTKDIQETQELQEIQEARKQEAKFGHIIFECITRLCTSHEQGLLDRKTNSWSKSDGRSERPRCEHSYVVYIYVCHSSSCSSSWARLYGKSAIYQESTLEFFWNSYFKRVRGWLRIRQK